MQEKEDGTGGGKENGRGKPKDDGSDNEEEESAPSKPASTTKTSNKVCVCTQRILFRVALGAEWYVVRSDD